MPAATPPPAGALPRPSLRGPRLLTALGVLLLLVALAVGAGAASLFVRTLPLEVLAGDGTAGPGIVGEVPLPGDGTVDLAAGRYTLWVAEPAEDAPVHGWIPDVVVTGPDGADVPVRGASVSGNATRGGVQAATVGGITVTAGGEHRLTVTDQDAVDGARLLIAVDDGFASFMGGIAGTLGLTFAAIGVGLAGVGVTVGGALWWWTRRRTPVPATAAPR